MILAIIILLIAVLVLAVVSIIWDMCHVKKMESGMKTMYKRIKTLEKNTMPLNYTIWEETNDTQMDPETEKGKAETLSTETDDEVQKAGDQM